MARRSAGGDSKQGLTVSLVLFVLLSIILAMTSYFGYSEANDWEKKYKNDPVLELAKHNKALEEFKKERDRARLAMAINAIMAGNLNKKDEAEYLGILAGLKNQYKDVYKTETERHAKLITWDLERPDKSYSERVQDLEGKLAAAEGGRKKTDATLEEARAAFQRDMANAINKLKDLAAAMGELKNDVDKRIKAIDDNYAKVVDAFEKNIVAAEVFAEKRATLEKEREELKAKLIQAQKEAGERIQKLEEQLPDRIDILAYDKPKGKIVRVEPNGQNCYLDLGTADLLRPGETFSVFAVGAYKANAKSKASLEVVRLLGEHLARARVTDIANPTRDPILTGDELYNPAFSPGIPERIAIMGLIDLTGDGRDGTLELVNNLQKHGVLVDAYLDTRDMAIKGRGIGAQTRYLLMGHIPDFTKRENVKENDPRQEKMLKIIEECKALQEQADKWGVKKVLARDFLSRMGYKVSRSQASHNDWNSNMLRQTGAAAQDAGKDKEMKGEGKEMKKEDGKEMKKDEK